MTRAFAAALIAIATSTQGWAAQECSISGADADLAEESRVLTVRTKAAGKSGDTVEVFVRRPNGKIQTYQAKLTGVTVDGKVTAKLDNGSSVRISNATDVGPATTPAPPTRKGALKVETEIELDELWMNLGNPDYTSMSRTEILRRYGLKEDQKLKDVYFARGNMQAVYKHPDGSKDDLIKILIPTQSNNVKAADIPRLVKRQIVEQEFLSRKGLQVAKYHSTEGEIALGVSHQAKVNGLSYDALIKKHELIGLEGFDEITQPYLKYEAELAQYFEEQGVGLSQKMPNGNVVKKGMDIKEDNFIYVPISAEKAKGKTGVLEVFQGHDSKAAVAYYLPVKVD